MSKKNQIHVSGNQLFKLVFLLTILVSQMSIISSNEINSEPWDNSKVNYRHPSKESIDRYKSLSEYQYETPESTNDFWTRLLNWLKRHFSLKDGETNWLEYSLYALAILVITMIVVYLFGIKTKGIVGFNRKLNNGELYFSLEKEDIHNNKLDQLLSDFVAKQEYREATRILYLICLRKLNDQKIIEWDISKTNRDYYYEIKDQNIRDKFRSILITYDYVWYGQFHIDKNKFDEIQQDVSNISTVKKLAV